MFRWGDAFGGREGKKVIQAGVLNDVGDLGDLAPELELFVGNRVKWVLPFSGIPKHEAMP